LRARVGIATGLVVVGDLIGEGAAQEQAVVGETPNLAARLQSLAEPGAVVISAATRRLLGVLFEYRDLGGIEAKGFAAPVQAYQVLRPSAIESRFEAARRGPGEAECRLRIPCLWGGGGSGASTTTRPCAFPRPSKGISRQWSL
jgi:hypothetical protein